MKKKRVWIIILCAVVVLAVAGGAFAYFFSRSGGSGSDYLKLDEFTVKESHFVYFCVRGYDAAYEILGLNGDAMWSAEVEGKQTERWIKDYAVEEGRRYLYVSKLFDELGLTLDETALNEIDEIVYDEWEYSGRLAIYGPMGVHEEDYRDIITYNKKIELLKEHYRDELGNSVTDEMIIDYLSENYLSFAYVTVSYIDVHETSLKDEYDAYCEEVEQGKTVIQLAEELHAEDNSRILTSIDEESGRSDICIPVDGSNFPLPFVEELQAAQTGAPIYFDDTANMTYNIASRTDILADDFYLDANREDIIDALTSNALDEKLNAETGAAEIDVNDGVVNRFDLKAIYETV